MHKFKQKNPQIYYDEEEMATFYANLVKMNRESEKSLFEKNSKSTDRKIQSFFSQRRKSYSYRLWREKPLIIRTFKRYVELKSRNLLYFKENR